MLSGKMLFAVVSVSAVLTFHAPAFAEPPELGVSRTRLQFGAGPGGIKTAAQTVFVSRTGEGSLEWTAAADQAWIHVQPLSGRNIGMLQVDVSPEGLSTGTHTGTVTVSAPASSNSPQILQVVLRVLDQTQPSIGSFEKPSSGTGVSGAVVLSGWALDDIGVSHVRLFLQKEGEPVLLGEAVFVQGARPDLEQEYPDYPNSSAAAWEFTWLSNASTGNVNGQATLLAEAEDLDGSKTMFEPKSINVENASPILPFGVIDDPAPGQVVTEGRMRVAGWGLTPLPRSIPTDGSTLHVFVDEQPVGNPVFDIYRQDIASLFPNHANSQGAGWAYDLDTTPYSNGIHTIGWTVTDDAGFSEGIGSRFFMIQHAGEGDPPVISVEPDRLRFGADGSDHKTPAQTVQIKNRGGGTLHWTAASDRDWLRIEPSSGTGTGIFSVSVDPAGLSAGESNGTVTVHDTNTANGPQTLSVILVRGAGESSPPFGGFDMPVDGSAVSGTVAVTGWALDDIAVDHVTIFREDNGSEVFLGDAVFVEGARPDAARLYPDIPLNTKAGWGFPLVTHFLPGGGNGTLNLVAKAADAEGHEVTLGTKTILVDNANAVKPFGAIDTPSYGGTASGAGFEVTGWVLTPRPNSILDGGSTLEVFIDGVSIGRPAYNIFRQDIASLLPGYANSNGAGWSSTVDTRQYADGVHTVSFTARDNAGRTLDHRGMYFTVDNPAEVSAADGREKTESPSAPLLESIYPNPFNPAASIAYVLPRGERVRLEVTDVRGRRVRTVVPDTRQTAGMHRATWDGKDDAGNSVPSGVYLVVLRAGGAVVCGKAVLLK